ncbi:PREDICTED: H-2 class I histocompatibility antigen, Q10 alpha chain-like [Thamnophis sirtalis]|uniref:H-2 class I histocompatibility antigen, Q10 alpha chain-like n=1 Tax=Thamnophis sirtalis TaxID=35019 RepID=A0A6I9XB62_9SAUR|nr:PREDICTED: H-2 class I histocompatibility antigen, Q10 alpha chain-like [Thamnophis sirtalis]
MEQPLHDALENAESHADSKLESTATKRSTMSNDCLGICRCVVYRAKGTCLTLSLIGTTLGSKLKEIGLHSLQWMCGCELRGDKSKRGFWQYGYEGRTFITFDKETLTWVAPEPQAQITQRKWDGVPGKNERQKSYLEEICIDWIEKYLSYGKETLLRTGEHLDPDFPPLWLDLLYTFSPFGCLVFSLFAMVGIPLLLFQPLLHVDPLP